MEGTNFMDSKKTPVPVVINQSRAAAASRAVTDGETVLATVNVSVSQDRVYSALTTKEVETWWGAPDVYRITYWKADVRVGGAWSLMVRLPNGSAFPANGQFLEIAAPGKIGSNQ
jgi:uncharacterized protein YndB with AHSA1/START domain